MPIAEVEEADMTGQGGAWMWILMSIGAVSLFGAGLAYGVWTWSRRSPAPERLRDRKTEELHSRRDPDEAALLPGQQC